MGNVGVFEFGHDTNKCRASSSRYRCQGVECCSHRLGVGVVAIVNQHHTTRGGAHVHAIGRHWCCGYGASSTLHIHTTRTCCSNRRCGIAHTVATSNGQCKRHVTPWRGHVHCGVRASIEAHLGDAHGCRRRFAKGNDTRRCARLHGQYPLVVGVQNGDAVTGQGFDEFAFGLGDAI